MSTSKQGSSYDILKVCGGIAVSVWGLNLLWGFIVTLNNDFAARLGDSFGAVNALFSSAAAAFAFYAVLLTQKQMDTNKRFEEHARQRDDIVSIIQAKSVMATIALEQDAILRQKIERLQEEEKHLNPKGVNLAFPPARLTAISFEITAAKTERQKLIGEALAQKHDISTLLANLAALTSDAKL